MATASLCQLRETSQAAPYPVSAVQLITGESVRWDDVDNVTFAIRCLAATRNMPEQMAQDLQRVALATWIQYFCEETGVSNSENYAAWDMAISLLAYGGITREVKDSAWSWKAFSGHNFGAGRPGYGSSHDRENHFLNHPDRVARKVLGLVVPSDIRYCSYTDLVELICLTLMFHEVDINIPDLKFRLAVERINQGREMFTRRSVLKSDCPTPNQWNPARVVLVQREGRLWTYPEVVKAKTGVDPLACIAGNLDRWIKTWDTL